MPKKGETSKIALLSSRQDQGEKKASRSLTDITYKYILTAALNVCAITDSQD